PPLLCLSPVFLPLPNLLSSDPPSFPCLFFSRLRLPPRPTLFPYTTLFRSAGDRLGLSEARELGDAEHRHLDPAERDPGLHRTRPDRKSTRLNSSHVSISYAVFCLKKKNTKSAKSLATREKQKNKIMN